MEIDRGFIDTLNRYGQQRKPTFFIIDFSGKDWSLSEEFTLFKLGKIQNYKEKNSLKKSKIKEKTYLSFDKYKQKFSYVNDEIKKGNSYFLNLTMPTNIKGNIDLETIFYSSNAPFKVLVKDKFVCFSPERFVKIEKNEISTYPMKGTIDASTKNAKEKILENKKEMAEHVMVVDLLRNDLGIVAKNIKVEKFRYIDKISAGDKKLLHVSSKISGELSENWHNSLGYIISKLLPAGSISGTPKKKTVEIINHVEGYERGFFTGIFGYYDGKSLDSAVMIRFIEKKGDDYFYKSGGGITIDSDVTQEYQEMKDKVYVPMF